MTVNNVAIQCQRCRVRSPDVLVLRGARFLVALCGGCALELPVVNERGEELRAVAIATEGFAMTREQGE